MREGAEAYVLSIEEEEYWPEIHESPEVRRIMEDPKIKECLEDIEKFDPEVTYKHVIKTAELIDELANRVKMPAKEKELLLRAALLHDVGKIYIDKKILDKPGKLTDEERKIVKKHTDIGATYLRNKGFYDEAEIVASHHKKEKGSQGQPEIERLARILAIVDIFEATTSNREYLKADKNIDESREKELQRFDSPEEKEIIKIMKSMM